MFYFFKKVVQEIICQIDSRHLSQTVSVRVPAHEVNYYGPIKHAGIVTERKLGQENNTHIQKWDRKYLIPLRFCSHAGRVVGSTFEATRQNPEVSVRNVDPVLKGVKLRLEQLTQVHEPPVCLQIHTHLRSSLKRSFYYSVSGPKQADHVQQHVYTRHL